MTNSARTVAGRLHAEVAAHRLQPDPTQFEAALRLDALSESLRARSPTILQRLRSRLSWLSVDQVPLRGLYLWGGVGRGKTLLMDLFVASLRGSDPTPREGAAPTSRGSADPPPREGAPPPSRRDATPTPRNGGAEARCLRSHFYHFMRDIHAELRSIKHHAEPLDIVAQRLAARVQVICLDEFFVADIGDAMLLARLFGALFRRGVTLVATSNLPPRDLYKDGLQRQRFLPAIDLIQAHVEVLHLDGGTDYRLRQLEQAPTYLDSTQPGTAAALRQRFEALAGGMAEGPSTLSIEGRPVRAVASGPGVVWFDFAELCDGPRSQSDYIEIARLYHTLIIADIPRFDRGSDNAARRFIMLIDELYDRGVKIVVSAAAPPAALYHGERLQFEFERAASRLIEMQTRDYLAGRHVPTAAPSPGIIRP